jgi:hypothetical protein
VILKLALLALAWFSTASVCTAALRLHVLEARRLRAMLYILGPLAESSSRVDASAREVSAARVALFSALVAAVYLGTDGRAADPAALVLILLFNLVVTSFARIRIAILAGVRATAR